MSTIRLTIQPGFSQFDSIIGNSSHSQQTHALHDMYSTCWYHWFSQGDLVEVSEERVWYLNSTTILHTTWQTISVSALYTFQYLLFLYDKISCRSASSAPSQQKFPMWSSALNRSVRRERCCLRIPNPFEVVAKETSTKLWEDGGQKGHRFFKPCLTIAPLSYMGYSWLNHSHTLIFFKNSGRSYHHKFRRKKIDQNSKFFWKIFSQSRCYLLS